MSLNWFFPEDTLLDGYYLIQFPDGEVFACESIDNVVEITGGYDGIYDVSAHELENCQLAGPIVVQNKVASKWVENE